MLLCSEYKWEEGIAGMPYVQEAVAGSFWEVLVLYLLLLPTFICIYHTTGNFYYEMGLRYICDKTPKK